MQTTRKFVEFANGGCRSVTMPVASVGQRGVLMYKIRRWNWGLATVLVMAGNGYGQVPGVPVAPPIAAPALPGAAAVPGATAGTTAVAGTTAAPAAGGAAPRNIWSFFMMTPEQKAAHKQNMAMCRAWFCQTRIGQFANNMLMPAGALTGGMLGPICPGPLSPNQADLLKPPTSAEGAAARIKAEEAQAKAKIAALEYLGTVDCHYYPEAQAALILGLRAEKNECVRLAAAKALANGCCCNAKVVKALTISVNCSSEDKFPSEHSELVRTYAYVALERCMRKCIEGEPEPSPEPPPAAKQAMFQTVSPFGSHSEYMTSILMANYFATSGGDSKVFSDARLTLSKGLRISPQTIERLSPPRNLRDAVMPGFEPIRPANLIDKLDTRKLVSAPKFITTLPKSSTPEPTEVSTATLREPDASVAEASAEAPMASSRAGRGNLLDIFKDSRRR